MLSERQGGRHTDREVVAADIEDVGGLDHLPDLRSIQVVDLVVIGGGEVGAHGAMLVSDDDTAFAGRGGWVDVVFYVEAWSGSKHREGYTG